MYRARALKEARENAPPPARGKVVGTSAPPSSRSGASSSLSAAPMARKPGVPTMSGASRGLAASGLGRSTMGGRGAGGAAAPGAALGAVAEAGASSSSSAAAAAAGGLLSPATGKLRVGSKAAALGLPSIVEGISKALQPDAAVLQKWGADYNRALALEWGKKEAGQSSLAHDKLAKQIMVDLKECLRDAVGARSGVLESAIEAEEAVIARFAEAAKLKPRVDELTAEKAGLEGRIAALTAELAAERERAAALEANGAQRETDFEAQMAENDRLASELADRDAQIAGLNGRLEEERAGAASLADDLEEARASGEQGVAARDNEIRQLRDSIAALEADANAKLSECQDEMERLERALEEAKGDLEIEHGKLTDAEEAVARLTLERNSARLEAEAAKRGLESEISHKRQTEDGMRTLVTTLREQVGDLSAQVKDAMKALAAEQARAGELSAQRDAAASAEAGVRLEMNKFVARCATLEARASEAATTISNLSGEIAADKAEIKRLMTELKDATATGEKLAREKDEADSRVSELQGRLLDASEKACKAADEAAAAKARATTAEAAQVTLAARLAAAEDREATMSKELGALRESAGSSESSQLDRISTMSREVEKLRQRLRDAGTEVGRLRSFEDTVARLREEVFAGEMARRGLHNSLQELKGNIRVYVRVRPFLPGDASAVSDEVEALVDPTTGAPKPAITCAPDGTSLSIVQPPPRAGGKDALPGAAARAAAAKPSKFAFDTVFGPRAGQDDVFAEVSHLVQSALDGYNVCLFSYGQTGSGKTWTMQGGSEPGSEGLIPRSVAQILATARRLASSAGWSYTLEASFLEIYNEAVRDLLRVPKPGGPAEPASLPIVNAAPAGGAGAGGSSSSSAAAADEGGANAGVEVPGLTKVPVDDEGTVAALLARAAKRRATASTAMNELSSRSHSVFTLYIKGTHPVKGVALAGTLNLVDLAGSERLDRSKAEGDRKKEAAAINKSLSCLADVFTALAQKKPHVPFRNSKLTHLLSPCFRGDGKTLMLVNLSPTAASAFESLCSLRFAAQVAQVELGQAKKRVTALVDTPAAAAPAAGARPSVVPASSAAASAAGGKPRAPAPAPAPSRPAAFKPLTTSFRTESAYMLSAPSASAADDEDGGTTTAGGHYDDEDAAAGGAYREADEDAAAAAEDDDDASLLDGEAVAPYADENEGGVAVDEGAATAGLSEADLETSADGGNDGAGDDEDGSMFEATSELQPLGRSAIASPPQQSSSAAAAGGSARKRLSGSKRPLEAMSSSSSSSAAAPAGAKARPAAPAAAVARKPALPSAAAGVGPRPSVKPALPSAALSASGRLGAVAARPVAAAAAAPDAKKPRLGASSSTGVGGGSTAMRR